MDKPQKKKRKLEKYLRKLDSVAVAFSSGVDSTFLLKTAHDVLSDKAVAVTAISQLVPEAETVSAKKFCSANRIEHITFEYDPFSLEGFGSNPVKLPLILNSKQNIDKTVMV